MTRTISRSQLDGALSALGIDDPENVFAVHMQAGYEHGITVTRYDLSSGGRQVSNGVPDVVEEYLVVTNGEN